MQHLKSKTVLFPTLLLENPCHDAKEIYNRAIIAVINFSQSLLCVNFVTLICVNAMNWLSMSSNATYSVCHGPTTKHNSINLS